MVESAKSDNDPLKRSQAAKVDRFGERIVAALNGRTMKWLSDLTGISTSMLSDYGRGKTPGADKALAIADALGVDLTWLLTGQGIAYLEDESGLEDRRAGFRGKTIELDDDVVEISEIDLRYGLGGTYLDNPVSSEKRKFSREWLRQFTHTPPEHLFWTVGDGDSMEPTIRSGEVVLVDTSQTTPRMAEGIWAMAMGEIGMIKRLHFAGKGRIELLSDNKVIPPIVVGEDELHVVGRVVAVVRRL